jgi:hypothetical protein
MAKRDIGVTAITPALAMLLSLIFLTTFFLIPIAQQLQERHADTTTSYQLGMVEKGGNQGLFATINRYNNAILEGINRLETDLEEGSFLRYLLLPPLQHVSCAFSTRVTRRRYPVAAAR